MHTEASVEIARPIDEVYRLTTNHVAQWSIVVVEDEMLTETESGVGSTFRSVTEDQGRRLEFAGEVTKCEPPRRHAIHLRGEYFEIEAEYTFEPLSSQTTRVTQSSCVTPKGWMRLMFLLFGWLMKGSSCKAVQAELDSLRAFCESRSATVQ